jgi:predicted amidohydrolase
MTSKPLEAVGGSRRIGLVQMRCEPDSEKNLARAQDAISDAARDGADVVCLPELFRTPYLCRSEDASRFDLAESIPGPSTEALAKQAADLGVSLVASRFERRAVGLYHNTAVVLDGKGELVGRYRKMHIPDDPLYYEKFYFTTLEDAEGTGIRFWGNSFVVDPFGRVLASAPDDEEAVLVVECDLGQIERVRRDWPFLRDRRVDAYAGLGERFLDPDREA